MAGRRGGRFWPLVVCVAALLPAPILCSEEHAVCSISCCEVLPSCDEAYHVRCSCQDGSLTSLRRGDIPKSVQSLTISTRDNLTIHREALLDLTSLVELRLYDMDTLEIQANGLKLHRDNMLIMFGIDNVRQVEVFSHALTGHWKDEAAIRIEAVKHLNVHENAFSYDNAVSSTGPSLMVKLIDDLNLRPRGLPARLAYFSLIYVRMQLCETGSFGPNTRRIDMKNATIGEVKRGCIKGSEVLTRLSIRSSTIGIIESRGIEGRIAEVTVDQSSIEQIHEDGFHLRVRSFHLTSSNIDELKSSSLSVLAADRIHFNSVKVGLLRHHALFDLQARWEDPYVRSMIVRNLYISQAEDGSLAFRDGTKLTLYNLTVASPRICPAEEWAKQLVGIAEDDSLRQVHNHVLDQLRPKIVCEDTGRFLRPLVHDISTENPPEPQHRRMLVDKDSAHSNRNGKDEDGGVVLEDSTVPRENQPPVVRVARIMKKAFRHVGRVPLYIILAVSIVLVLVAAGTLLFKLNHSAQNVTRHHPIENEGYQEAGPDESSFGKKKWADLSWCSGSQPESLLDQPLPDSPDFSKLRRRMRPRSKSLPDQKRMYNKKN